MTDQTREARIEAARTYITASGYCYRPTSGEPLLSHFMADFSLSVEQKWVEIRSEEDLPKVEGWYLVKQHRYPKDWSKYWFNPNAPGRVFEWMQDISHWMIVLPAPKEDSDDER